MKLRLFILLCFTILASSNVFSQNYGFRKVLDKKFKTFVYDEDTKKLFALGQDNFVYNIIISKNGLAPKAVVLYSRPVESFIIYDNKLLFVSKGRLFETDLVTKRTKSHTLNLKNIIKISEIYNHFAPNHPIAKSHPDSIRVDGFQVLTSDQIIAKVSPSRGKYAAHIYNFSKVPQKPISMLVNGIVCTDGKLYRTSKSKPNTKWLGNNEIRAYLYNVSRATLRENFLAGSGLSKAIGPYYYSVKNKKIEKDTEFGIYKVKWANNYLNFLLPSKINIKDFFISKNLLFAIDDQGNMWQELIAPPGSAGQNQAVSKVDKDNITKIVVAEGKVYGLGKDGILHIYLKSQNGFIVSPLYTKKVKDISSFIKNATNGGRTVAVQKLILYGEDGIIYTVDSKTNKVEPL